MTHLRLRGGFAGSAPPIPTMYGPSMGIEPVKNGTLPRAITVPSGSYTTVSPGDDVATKITTAGAGGTLWFTKGTYTVTASLVPLVGQTWVLESAAGYTRTAADSAVMDGANALTNALVLGGIGNVTIRGGLWTRQGTVSTAVSTAAVQHTKGAVPADGGWLVEDAIISSNRNVGLKFTGPSCTARRCYIHSNGRYGVNLTGVDPSVLDGNHLLEKCRVSNNNTLHYEPGGDAGGTKFGIVPGTTIRQNWFHDNYGAGIWFDYDSFDCDIEDNVVEYNRNWGIFWEVCFGGTYIQRNYLNRNGETTTAPDFFNSHQILLSTSDGEAVVTVHGAPFTPRFSSIEVQYNQLVGSSVYLGPGEFTGRQLYTINTSGHIGDGASPARANHFHDNDVTIASRSGTECNIAGAATNTGADEVFLRDNTWEANHYHVPSGDTGLAWWRWVGAIPGVGATKTWAQWNASGQDVPDGELD